jgi:hypothetical protein
MRGTVQFSNEVVAERLSKVLRDLYGDFKASAKRLALRVGADPRAAANWLSGTNAPQLNIAIDLMAADPEIEDAILDMVRTRREAMCKKSALNSSSPLASASASASANPAT